MKSPVLSTLLLMSILTAAEATSCRQTDGAARAQELVQQCTQVFARVQP